MTEQGNPPPKIYRELKVYQVCSNDDPRLTIDLFTARSNLPTCALICMGKILKHDFLKIC